MGERYFYFVKSDVPEEFIFEVEEVKSLARRLESHIETHQVEIDALHVHGAQSKTIQDFFATFFENELGFSQEVVMTPQDGLVSKARPDFFKRLSSNRGIIAEVERGGTVSNNHDLKDLWKAHISPDTQHLFLIVPVSNWKPDGSIRENLFQSLLED